MGLFGRKKGVEIDELCARYYQYEVFNNPEYYDIAFSYIAENCDASTMNKKLVENELIALRMEAYIIRRLPMLFIKKDLDYLHLC